MRGVDNGNETLKISNTVGITVDLGDGNDTLILEQGGSRVNVVDVERVETLSGVNEFFYEHTRPGSAATFIGGGQDVIHLENFFDKAYALSLQGVLRVTGAINSTDRLTLLNPNGTTVNLLDIDEIFGGGGAENITVEQGGDIKFHAAAGIDTLWLHDVAAVFFGGAQYTLDLDQVEIVRVANPQDDTIALTNAIGGIPIAPINGAVNVNDGIMQIDAGVGTDSVELADGTNVVKIFNAELSRAATATTPCTGSPIRARTIETWISMAEPTRST